ncbi:MAG TPA: Rab family GTPase [Chthoniobacteraceae bacterium]|nr:Rab family GTPase [Chthoniobacteraceae bacterium]
MAISNYTARKVQFKIVIYGPPHAGKTTTLHCLHSRLDTESTSEFHTLKSAADKTLSFEFIARDATLFGDFKIQFEVSTVPGEVVFNAPRKLVLRDADGILFVADSEWARVADDVASFKNLEENLKKLGAGVDDIPLVLAFNKRDLPDVAPAAYLDFVLNNRKRRVPSFETQAADGSNIVAAFRALCELVVQHFLESNPEASAVASVSEA